MMKKGEPMFGRLAPVLALFLALFLALGAALPVRAGETYVELILDASGSMYNKLADGRYRITAAKDVLRDFVAGLPEAELNVGLRIYGSRKGAKEADSCRDSELFVPLEGVDKPALLSTIRNTRAKGSTPIAYSLQQAANDFPAEAGKCLIVLVTDGEEVCDGDVQASAAALQQRGCDVDLRIIGFDLTAQAIKSFDNVGTFENATNAADLAAALARAVEPVVEKDPLGAAQLEAPEEVSAGSAFAVGWIAQEGDRDYVTIVPAEAEDGVYKRYAYTRDGNPLTLYAPAQAGDYELRYQSDRVPGVSGRRAIRVVPAEIALDAPSRIPAGQPFDVVWIGPDGERDYITIVPARAADNTYKSYRYTRTGSPLRLHASIQSGPHEIRYQSDREPGVFARRPVEVVPAQIVLDAPAVLKAGSPFEVQWQGPNGERDYLTVVPANAPAGQYTNYSYTRSGSPAPLHAPMEPGDYEVRYQSDREPGVFARLPITIEPVEAHVQGPTEVAAGAVFEVLWQGPDGDRDYVTIVPSGSPPGTYRDYKYTRTGPSIRLTAPNEPGDYEIRYQSDRERQYIFARQPIKVLNPN